MEYKVIIILTFAFLLELPCQKNKDPDEDRAYEFGFTIDGQQHRHEKKDANGIIQGEFGFITADGIYHVTVYATDENGDFKILSMKNIKVSPPLDGSPGPGPGQTKISHGQNGTISQPHKRTDTLSSTQRTPFTTLPTIKPACAGCGYVTTQKPLPGQKFSSLTPFNSVKNNPNTLQNQQLRTPNIPIGGNAAVQYAQDPILIQGPVPMGQPQEGNTLGQQSNVPTNAISSTSVLGNDPKQPNQLPHHQNVPQQSVLGSTPQVSNNAQNQSPQNNEVQNPISQPPSYSDSFSNPQNGLNGDLSSRIKPNTQHTSNIINRTPDSPGTNTSNPAGITVSNGAIHVPGNPDIPIKDKYPGMVDGLPPGIEQKDIKDILYKFNYTVGFHGHYETGYKNGAKIGGYFVNGRDGISRIVTYVADENGFRPKVKFINLGLDSPDTPKEDTEKTFGLKNFEFVWYPLN